MAGGEPGRQWAIGSNPSWAQANLGSDRFSHREKRVRFYFPSVSPPTLTGKTAVVLFLEICAETNVSELTSIVVTPHGCKIRLHVKP